MKQISTSSYRNKQYNLKRGVNELYFDDTYPNNVVFNTFVNSPIYIGLSANVSPSNYVVRIPANSNGSYSYINGTNIVYIYSEEAGRIGITSWEGNYNSDYMLNNMTADIVSALSATNIYLSAIVEKIRREYPVEYITIDLNGQNQKTYTLPEGYIGLVMSAIHKSNSNSVGYLDGQMIYYNDMVGQYFFKNITVCKYTVDNGTYYPTVTIGLIPK